MKNKILKLVEKHKKENFPRDNNFYSSYFNYDQEIYIDKRLDISSNLKVAKFTDNLFFLKDISEDNPDSLEKITNYIDDNPDKLVESIINKIGLFTFSKDLAKEF